MPSANVPSPSLSPQLGYRIVQTYSPYKQANQGLSEAGGKQRFLTPNTSGFAVSELDFQGNKVRFFREVAAFIDGARRQKIFGHWRWPFQPFQCSPALKQAMRLQQQHRCDQTKLQPSLNRISNLCTILEQPERRFRNTPQNRDYVESRFGTVQGLIDEMGNGVAGHTWAPWIVNDDRSMLRDLLFKVYLPQTMTETQKTRASLTTQSSQFLNNPACFTSPAQRAQFLADANKLSNDLNQLTQALQTYRQQRQAVAQQAQCKGTLPDPHITPLERRTLSSLIAGSYWRARGGGVWPKRGTQANRFHHAGLVFQTLSRYNGAPQTKIRDHIVRRLQAKGYSKYWHMGEQQNTLHKDFVRMTERGLSQVGVDLNAKEVVVGGGSSTSLLTLFGNMGHDTSAIRAGGSMFGACYYAAHKFLRNTTFDPKYPPWMWQFSHNSYDTAEICFGMTLAWGLSYSHLHGLGCRQNQRL